MAVTAELHPARVTAAPGERAGCAVLLRNSGPAPVVLAVGVSGTAGRWSWANPAHLSVPPGGEATVRVVFRLPVGADPPAGPLTFTVAVTGGEEPVAVAGTLEVAAAPALGASLRPDPARPGGMTLTVHNRGNTPLRAVLRSPDPAVTIEPAVVEVGVGGAAESEVSLEGGRRLLARSQAAVAVEVAAGGASATATATLARPPLMTRWAAWAAAAGLVAAGVVVLLPGADTPPRGAARTASGGVPASAVPTTIPSCPAEGHRSPFGVVQVDDELRPVGGAGRSRPAPRDYAFLLAGDDGCSPIRFDACAPVRYVVNPSLAPSAEAVNNVHEAVAHLAEASGLRFVYDGETDETFAGNFGQFVRPPYQPDRYGERWAPLLVTWTRGGFAASRDDRVIAGGGHPTLVDGRFVTAQVVLNAAAYVDPETRAPIPAGFGPGIAWGRVLLHELGHAVGLGHVINPAQLMHEPLTDHPPAPARYAAGDRAGLALLGRGLPCVEAPAPPAATPVAAALTPR